MRRMRPLLNLLALREAIKKLTVRDVTKGWKGWLHCPGNWHLQPVICSCCLLADMWKVQQSINSSETQCCFCFFLLVAHNVGAKLAAFWNPKSGILTRRWSNPQLRYNFSFWKCNFPSFSLNTERMTGPATGFREIQKNKIWGHILAAVS